MTTKSDFESGIHSFTGKRMSSFSPRQRGSMALEAALNSVKQRARLQTSGTANLDIDTSIDSFGLGLELRIEMRKLGYRITKIPTPRT